MAGLVTILCPCCPRELRVRPEHVSLRVSCKFCASIFRVPAHVPIPCPKCDQEGMVRTEHLGRKIRCKSCGHAFRARVRAPVGRDRSDREIRRLAGEIDRREVQLVDLRRQLEEARGELLTLDARARALTDGRDVVQRTEEWSIIEDEPDDGPSNGTEPDLPMADLDDSDPHTRLVGEDDEEPHSQLTHTRLAESQDAIEALREECALLRRELETMRESADRTVITRDQTETLERDLAVARADNVRLAAEREEIHRTVEGLMRLLRDRDAMLVELTRERDESRAAFDLAESARLALADEVDRVRSEQSEADTEFGQVG